MKNKSMESGIGLLTPEFQSPQAWPVYDAETIARATSLIKSNRVFDYGRGVEIGILEDEFERRYEGWLALAFNSGTSALYAAFWGLGFRDGAEVIVPTFTFQSTATPLLALGAIPIPCDVGGPDGNVTAATIAARLSERTVGVVVTHLFGAPCQMVEIAELCRQHSLMLIEDCSHAHASLYNGRAIGMYGDASVFSLSTQKLVSGGHGGMLLTRSHDLFDMACLIGHFKQRVRASVLDSRLRALEDFALGGNLRISPLAAVLAYGHLRRLSELGFKKRVLAERLLTTAEEFLGVERLQTIKNGENNSYQDICVMLPVGAGEADRDSLIEYLRERGLLVRKPATGLLHRAALMSTDSETLARLPVSRDHIERMRQVCHAGGFENSEDLYDRLISFPSAYVYESMDWFVDGYVEAIRKIGIG